MAEQTIKYGPPTNARYGSCFLDTALVALLHVSDPAIFHLLKPVTDTTLPQQKQLRNDLVIIYDALQKNNKPTGMGGWTLPRARIRALLSKRHFDPKEFMMEQQDARAAISMLLDSLEAFEPHIYDETNHKGDVVRTTKTIYRETLLPERDPKRTTLPDNILLDGTGTIMRDIVVDGKERHILRSLSGNELPIKLCWFFGIRRVSDIVKEPVMTEILKTGRNIVLPDEIKVWKKNGIVTSMKLVSIILRTLGTIHGGHYTCLILREDRWWLYDGMGESSTADMGSLTQITKTKKQDFAEILKEYAIVGAYYQEN